MLQNIWDGRLHVKGLMRSLRVVPDEIVREFPVERRKIIEEKVLIVIHELFLDGPIEPFAVHIHLWRPWVRMPVSHVMTCHRVLEVQHEFTSVVRQDVLDFHGQGFKERFNDPCGFFRRMTLCPKGKSEPGIGVDERHEIPSRSFPVDLNGIKAGTLKGSLRDVSFRFPFFLHWFSYFSKTRAAWEALLHPHLRGIIRNEATDRRNRGTGEALSPAPAVELRVDLLFSEVRMVRADHFDHADRLNGPETPASCSWGAILRVQPRETSVFLMEPSLPEKQRPSAYGKRIKRRS